VVGFTSRPVSPGNRALGTHSISGSGWGRGSLDTVERTWNSCCCRESNHNLSDVQPIPSQYTEYAVSPYVLLIQIMEGNLTLACSYPFCFADSGNRNNQFPCRCRMYFIIFIKVFILEVLNSNLLFQNQNASAAHRITNTQLTMVQPSARQVSPHN
jgi:hypothetical protein